MNEVYLGRGKSGRVLRLGKLLGEGASGKVHAIDGEPGVAAKIYHGPDEARRYEAKIEAMLAKPPELPPAINKGASYPQIAWPTAKLHDRAGSFIGFLMPEIDFARSTSLVNLLQKNSRKLEGISDYYGYRVLVARNLASVFAELHRAGHHMIDLKPANLRFYPAVSWMAVVDADGFSIAGANGRIGALQLSDEYIAPENWKRKPAELGLGQDLFALAAIIFQLLNNGVHPFAGTISGSTASDLQTRIVEGHYPYALAPKPGLTPSTASIHRMFRRTTRAMFDLAFLGVRRPSAAQWRDHLDELVAQLTPCAARPGEHVHFGGGCGFCGHEARIEAVRNVPRHSAEPRPARPVPPPILRSPLPSPQVVRWPRPLPPRRKSPIGLVLRSSALAALLGLVLVGSDRLWQEMLARQAHAETAPASAPSYRGPLTELSEPREYQIISPGTVSRDGPGDRYPTRDPIGFDEVLTGTATAKTRDGSRWILVTRPGGDSGFVAAASLVEASQLAAPLECAEGESCVSAAVTAHESILGKRYRELLGRSDPAKREILKAGQRAWETDRVACQLAARPGQCRIDATVRRMSALDSFAIGGRL